MVAGGKCARPSATHPPRRYFNGVETLATIWVSNPLVVLNLLQSLLAILLGNVVYFLLLPSLPFAARHRPHHIDLGMVLDFWICLVIYGTIRTVRKWR